jgi:hypothetical protein
LFSGAFAGVCAYSLVYPVDTIKTLLATNKLSPSIGIFSNIQNLYLNFGIKRLYRGLPATCFGIFPYAGLKFFFFNYYKELLSSGVRDNASNALINLISGALAGCSAVSVTYPTDLIRRRKQFFGQAVGTEKGFQVPGYREIFMQVFRNEGLRGFYKGLLCTYCKIIPSTAFVFCINGFLNNVGTLK